MFPHPPVCIVQITFPPFGETAFPISPNQGGRQVEKKQLVNCINSFWPPQYIWYPNPSLLTWQGEVVWCWLIGRSSCRSGRHLPSHLLLIMQRSSLSSALSGSDSQNSNRQIGNLSLASAFALQLRHNTVMEGEKLDWESTKRKRRWVEGG